mmetsp:Transcript_40862/g.95412  ORF Transcript_40862/g.95412 Transcript_40862/m.95412 type:complete len:136 (-) Transcript_40862:289-696(-)
MGNRVALGTGEIESCCGEIASNIIEITSGGDSDMTLCGDGSDGLSYDGCVHGGGGDAVAIGSSGDSDAVIGDGVADDGVADANAVDGMAVDDAAVRLGGKPSSVAGGCTKQWVASSHTGGGVVALASGNITLVIV